MASRIEGAVAAAGWCLERSPPGPALAERRKWWVALLEERSRERPAAWKQLRDTLNRRGGGGGDVESLLGDRLPVMDAECEKSGRTPPTTPY